MSTSKKVIIITAIVVAVIALGAIAFFITQRQKVEKAKPEQPAVTAPEAPKKPVTQSETPTTTEPIDTSDWKVYRNGRYGFEMKYPPDLKVEIERKDRRVVIIGNEHTTKEPSKRIAFTISVVPWKFDDMYRSFLESQKKREERLTLQPDEIVPGIGDVIRKTVSGKEAFCYTTYSRYPELTFQSCSIARSASDVLSISYQEDELGLLGISGNQILSTFKFIK